MKLALVLFLSLTLAGAASAQHSHGEKGPNGGQMEDVAGIHAELLTSGTTVTLNIFDESVKPMAVKGFTASALITSGSDRETLALQPTDGNTLKGEAKKPVRSGSTISVTLKTASGKSGQARFKN